MAKRAVLTPQQHQALLAIKGFPGRDTVTVSELAERLQLRHHSADRRGCAQFIGQEMRLSKIEYAPKPEHVPLLNLYMGKNTPERKDYIMERLVVPVEE